VYVSGGHRVPVGITPVCGWQATACDVCCRPPTSSKATASIGIKMAAERRYIKRKLEKPVSIVRDNSHSGSRTTCHRSTLATHPVRSAIFRLAPLEVRQHRPKRTAQIHSPPRAFHGRLNRVYQTWEPGGLHSGYSLIAVHHIIRRATLADRHSPSRS